MWLSLKKIPNFCLEVNIELDYMLSFSNGRYVILELNPSLHPAPQRGGRTAQFAPVLGLATGGPLRQGAPVEGVPHKPVHLVWRQTATTWSVHSLLAPFQKHSEEVGLSTNTSLYKPQSWKQMGVVMTVTCLLGTLKEYAYRKSIVGKANFNHSLCNNCFQIVPCVHLW